MHSFFAVGLLSLSPELTLPETPSDTFQVSRSQLPEAEAGTTVLVNGPMYFRERYTVTLVQQDTLVLQRITNPRTV